MHKSVECSFYTVTGQRLVGEWRNSVSADRPLEYQAMEILAILPVRFWGVCGAYAQAIHEVGVGERRISIAAIREYVARTMDEFSVKNLSSVVNDQLGIHLG